jgi:hypothetical protein
LRHALCITIRIEVVPIATKASVIERREGRDEIHLGKIFLQESHGHLSIVHGLHLGMLRVDAGRIEAPNLPGSLI